MQFRYPLVALAWLLVMGVAQADPQLPTPCPADGRLGYYACRADDAAVRNPDQGPPAYYRDYADRYVRRFTEQTGPLLSPAGQVWLAKVRAGLQQALEDYRQADPVGFAALERDDAAFLDYAYATHPRAYMQAGLDQLPVRDLLLIGSTPDLQDLFTARGRAQLMEVLGDLAGGCREQGLGACLAERVVRELRERRRLWGARLRGERTGWLPAWLVRRWADSAARALRGQPAPRAGLADALPTARSPRP